MLIQEMFTSVQGEGFWSGCVSDFIRIYGCPVGCPWCDTGYSDGGKQVKSQSLPIEHIVSQCHSDRVVVTGGEPTVNPHFHQLVLALLSKNKQVQVETAGIKWVDIDSVWFTLSPKEHVSGYSVDPRYWDRANEIKIVVESVPDFEQYLDRINQAVPVFVQSCDNGSPLKESVKPALAVVHKYPWVRLSLQTHKLIGVQ